MQKQKKKNFLFYFNKIFMLDLFCLIWKATRMYYLTIKLSRLLFVFSWNPFSLLFYVMKQRAINTTIKEGKFNASCEYIINLNRFSNSKTKPQKHNEKKKCNCQQVFINKSISSLMYYFPCLLINNSVTFVLFSWL